MSSLAFLTTRVLLPQGKLLRLGRDNQIEIPVPDPHISRHHAVLKLLPDGSLYVADSGSVNGLFCGDERVPYAVLRPGQEFLLGVVGFRFE
ncbi:MAG TPA: FHA domain-containing protein [Fibrobacteria bacterium]|nr:FHA domain-containing protein [Fibrobacteria bacterium]